MTQSTDIPLTREEISALTLAIAHVRATPPKWFRPDGAMARALTTALEKLDHAL